VFALGGCDRVYEEIQTTVYVRVDPPLKPYASQYINGNYVQSGQILSFALRNYGDWMYGGYFFALNEIVYRDLDIKYRLQLEDYSDFSVHTTTVDVVYNGDTVHHAVHLLRDSASVWNNPAEAIGTFRIR
jgi:hypothetical protein